MTGGVDAAAYGKAAGYSEDYATPKPAAETQLMTKAEEAGKSNNLILLIYLIKLIFLQFQVSGRTEEPQPPQGRPRPARPTPSRSRPTTRHRRTRSGSSFETWQHRRISVFPDFLWTDVPKNSNPNGK